MLPELKGRALWIALLVLSSLWVAGTFGPLLYSMVWPTEDLSRVVLALGGRAVAPPAAVALVRQTLDEGGSLQRAVHVAHYVSMTTIHHHTSTEISDAYIAWFSKIPAPIPLVVKRFAQDGAVQRYEVGSAGSWMPSLQGYSLPLIALAVSIFFVGKRKWSNPKPLSNQSREAPAR